MRVLGVLITSTDLSWLLVDGVARQGHIELLSQNKLVLPVSEPSPIANLIRMQELISAHIEEIGFDAAAYLRATKDSAPETAKIELLFQLSCNNRGVPAVAYVKSAVTRSVNNHFATAVGQSKEAAFNDGVPIVPKYLEAPFLVAWKHLYDNS